MHDTERATRAEVQAFGSRVIVADVPGDQERQTLIYVPEDESIRTRRGIVMDAGLRDEEIAEQYRVEKGDIVHYTDSIRVGETDLYSVELRSIVAIERQEREGEG